jgi:hypothetical protein
MEVFELFIDESKDRIGVEAISIVEQPAIEEDFVALKSQKIEMAQVSAEKKILMGPALIPNKHIYRRNELGDEYYIFFSEDTVRKAAQLFLSNGNQNNSTLEHEYEINGLSVVESWIVEDEEIDKSSLYNLKMPKGTWMVSVKVNNQDVWDDYVKTGKVKGFSIEGYFSDKSDMLSKILKKEDCQECVDELNAEFTLLEAIDAFSEVELESYGGYPDSAVSNAKLGIERNKELGNKCATQVGKVRAQQIVSRENFTLPTLKRIYSYLSRAEEYYDPAKPEACGTISYLLWGGKTMKSWVESKLRGLDEIE